MNTSIINAKNEILHNMKTSTLDILKNDNGFNKLKINIVNSCDDIAYRYRNSILTNLSYEAEVILKFYTSSEELESEIFSTGVVDSDHFLQMYIFNLNYCKHICENPKCRIYGKESYGCDNSYQCISTLCQDIYDATGENKIRVHDQVVNEINRIVNIKNELSSNLDSKYYNVTLVSLLNRKIISSIYETITKQKSPIDGMNYLNFDFEDSDILFLIYNILHTHSDKFLKKWESVIEKLEAVAYAI